MNETPNLELFYDVLDESISKLYEIKKQSFLNLLIETGKNIVSQDVLNACDQNIIIPLNNNVESLNVGIAGAILMWELKK